MTTHKTSTPPAGTLPVKIILTNGEERRALLTGGLHGQLFQDRSLLRLVKVEDAATPVNLTAEDIELLLPEDGGQYDAKTLLGMSPYLLTMNSGREIPLHCFRIKRSDPWVVGFARFGGALRKTFVNSAAVQQFRRQEETEASAKPANAPAGKPSRSTTPLPVDFTTGAEYADDALAPAPDKPPRDIEPQIGRILDHIKQHGLIDYKKICEYLEITATGLQKKIRLGDLLTRENFISDRQLQEALVFQKNDRKRRLGEILVYLGHLNEQLLAITLAIQARLPFTLLTSDNVEAEVISIFTAAMAWKYDAVPIRQGSNHVLLAVADPSIIDVQEISFIINQNVSLIVTQRQDLQAVILRHYGKQDELASMSNRDSREIHLDEHPEEDESVDTIVAKGKEAPIIALVNQIIIDAVDKKASDIHIIPEKKVVRVTFRINGTLHDISHLSKNLQNYLIARIKILCGMNIVERRLPQDGRIHGRAHEQTVDLRVSALPAQHGETLVLRLRYPDKQLPALADLGFSAPDLALVRQAISRSKGMILVTGPTGSGKSTTLISFLLAIRDQPDKVHIITAEDPVEMVLPGLTQIPVNAAIGMTFPRILRNILRHDPDVIMVGEIRDKETAKIAVQAALTGHLVLSTLHTNDSLSAMARLEDLELEPFMINAAVNIIIAQRLIRTLCDCAEPYLPGAEEKALLAAMGRPIDDGTKLKRPRGCDKCHGSGYAGRSMTYELFAMDNDIRALNPKAPDHGASLRAILAQKGFVSLVDHGLNKVMAGETALAEVMRHWEG